MPTYTFSCPACGWSDDLRGKFDVRSVPCQRCGTDARRAEVYAINFNGFTPTPLDQMTYHQEFKDFLEASAELDYSKARSEQPAGFGNAPIATAAAKQAKQLRKAGVTSSEDWKARKKH